MGFRDWGLGVLKMSGPTVGIRWILKILHDPKYLLLWPCALYECALRRQLKLRIPNLPGYVCIVLVWS